MAKVSIEREPAPPPIKKVTLELSPEEAITILYLCGHVIGNSTTARKFTDNIYFALEEKFGSIFNDDKLSNLMSKSNCIDFGHGSLAAIQDIIKKL